MPQKPARATHYLVFFTDLSKVSRHATPAKCRCQCAGQQARERVDLCACLAPGESIEVHLLLHGTVVVRAGIARLGSAAELGGAVVLPAKVRSVRAVEAWLLPRPPAVFRAPALENVCSSLPPQDMSSCLRSGAASTINKCFGRKHCVYTFEGNVSFQGAQERPQFRGVVDCARFADTLAGLGVCFTGALAHLAVFSGNFARRVLINEHGALVRTFPAATGFRSEPTMQEADNVVRYSAVHAGCKFNVTVTLHGHVVVRASFFLPRPYTPELEAWTATQVKHIFEHLVPCT